jgi:hypothetical protein
MTAIKTIRGGANVFGDPGFDVHESQNLLLLSKP